jgi:hypothetical protein
MQEVAKLSLFQYFIPSSDSAIKWNVYCQQTEEMEILLHWVYKPISKFRYIPIYFCYLEAGDRLEESFISMVKKITNKKFETPPPGEWYCN